jgi:hypothetical protein
LESLDRGASSIDLFASFGIYSNGINIMALCAGGILPTAPAAE